MKTLSKTINISNIDVKFTVDADVYYNCDDDKRISIEMRLKASECSDSKSIMFIYEINRKTLKLTLDEANDVKKLIKEFEQETIDLINRRSSIEQQIDAVLSEMSYNTK